MLKKLVGRNGPLGVFTEFPVLITLGIICVCAEMSWATLLIVMEFYFKEELLREQSPQFIASKVATAWLAFVGLETIFKYKMGALSDKYGPRPFVLLSLGICTITPLILVLINYFFDIKWFHFIPLRALDGFAAAALWPAMSAMMAHAVPRSAKAAAMSVFNAAYCLGLAVGPMLGLYLGHRFGSNIYVFPLCSALMFIGLIIAYRTLNFPAATARGIDHDEVHSGESIEADKSLLRSRPLLMRMMALYALSQLGVGVLGPTIPIYIETQFGITQGDLPRMIAFPALLVVLIAIPLGRVPDTLGRARSVWVSYVLAAVGMLCISLTSLMPRTTELVSFPVALFGFGVTLMIVSFILGTPAWLGLTSLQVDSSRQAQALSLMQTAQGVGVVIAFSLVTFAGYWMTQWKKVGARLHHEAMPDATQLAVVSKDAVPLSVWFWLSTVVFFLCMIGTLIWVREPEHDDRAEELAASAKQPLEITGV
ncbi:MAG TPA: MFS transporter [Abditibacteriaceae bacterium]|jgi:MFS family permease